MEDAVHVISAVNCLMWKRFDWPPSIGFCIFHLIPTFASLLPPYNLFQHHSRNTVKESLRAMASSKDPRVSHALYAKLVQHREVTAEAAVENETSTADKKILAAEKEMLNLKGRLDRRDRTIEDLQEHIKDLRAQLNRRDRSLADRDEQISKLKIHLQQACLTKGRLSTEIERLKGEVCCTASIVAQTLAHSISGERGDKLR